MIALSVYSKNEYSKGRIVCGFLRKNRKNR